MPHELSIEVPTSLPEVPFVGDELHDLYNTMKRACGGDLTHIDIHYFDSFRAVAWFIRYVKRNEEMHLFESSPFHAGWIARTTVDGHSSFHFDIDAYKLNAYRFVPHRRVLWNVLSEKIHGGIKYKGTPKHAIKRVAFSVYNDVDVDN